jgi:protein gp37
VSELYRILIASESIGENKESLFRHTGKFWYRIAKTKIVMIVMSDPNSNNIWMGVSVENRDYTYRIDHLQKVPAAIRFLSVEPLLGPIPRLPLQGIDWVIVGGESGPGCRKIDPDWVRNIRDRCLAQGVPFFFKQWGGTRKKLSGRELDGRTWDEMPDTRPRELERVAI